MCRRFRESKGGGEGGFVEGWNPETVNKKEHCYSNKNVRKLIGVDGAQKSD